MPKPAAVISRPTSLSCRRRQATRPHAANETPTSRKTTSEPAIGGSEAKIAGTSATKPRTAASTHSVTQNQTPWAGAARRRSTFAPLRARGAATSPLTPASEGATRIICLDPSRL